MTLAELKAAAEKAGMAKFFVAGKTRDELYVIGQDFLERLHVALQEPSKAPEGDAP